MSTKNQQSKSSGGVRESGKNFDLTEEEYAMFLFYSIFNVHYLPWLKRTAPAEYRHQNYSQRLHNMSNNIALAFPDSRIRKKLVIELSQQYCFRFKRKLCLKFETVSLQPIGKNDANSSLSASPKTDDLKLIFWVLFRNTDDDGRYEFYKINDPVEIQPDYSLFIDLPIELNDTTKETTIELYYQSSDDPTRDGKYCFFTTHDYEISGYTGFLRNFTIQAYHGMNVSFQLNLQWELERQNLFNQIQRPDLLLKFFSGTLLALGTYFFRFYSAVYAELLTQKSTRIQALECFAEVAFVLNSLQRSGLCPEILLLCDQWSTESGGNDPDWEYCFQTQRLVHAVLILLDSSLLSLSNRIQLCKRLLRFPFRLALSANYCYADPPQDGYNNNMLLKLLIRRLYQFLKKQNQLIYESCFEELILNLLFDSLLVGSSSIEYEVIVLFVRYFKTVKLANNETYIEAKQAAAGEEPINNSGSKIENDGSKKLNNNPVATEIKTETSLPSITDEILLMKQILIKSFPQKFSNDENFIDSSGNDQLPPPPQVAIKRLLRQLVRQFHRNHLMNTAVAELVVSTPPPSTETGYEAANGTIQAGSTTTTTTIPSW